MSHHKVAANIVARVYQDKVPRRGQKKSEKEGREDDQRACNKGGKRLSEESGVHDLQIRVEELEKDQTQGLPNVGVGVAAKV